MRRAAVLLVAICLAGGITGTAKADGTIILNNAHDFQTNIDNGFIGGIGSGQAVPFQQQVASQSALVSAFPGQTLANSITTTSSQLNGLISAAPSPGGSGQYASSWTYGYHIDPDLSNYTIKLGLSLPQVSTTSTDSGINMVTIALTSVATVNNQPVYSTRVWGFDNTLTPSILSPDPNTNIENFSLAAIMGAGAGGSNYFNQDNGFDIQNVWYLSIGYRGLLGNTYPPTPNNTSALWIGTTSLDVTAATPEPSSALVLACGILGVGLLRFSQRARSRRRKMLVP